MIDTTLEEALTKLRTWPRLWPTNNAPTSEGCPCMAWIFEDRPTGKCLGLFTHSFAERFCGENPGYVWRAA